ncbi:MAG: hypothetical protein LBK60_04850 [Verrucomicrobiales bacterium]|nr:hypothetical protein [Verrucomicrobiales bacterium]
MPKIPAPPADSVNVSPPSASVPSTATPPALPKFRPCHSSCADNDPAPMARREKSITVVK